MSRHDNIGMNASMKICSSARLISIVGNLSLIARCLLDNRRRIAIGFSVTNDGLIAAGVFRGSLDFS